MLLKEVDRSLRKGLWWCKLSMQESPGRCEAELTGRQVEFVEQVTFFQVPRRCAWQGESRSFNREAGDEDFVFAWKKLG